MGELYNPYPKLPKNIRQVGERDSIVKLYMEDYVNTYLNRLSPGGGRELRVGLLLGELRSQDGMDYLFVDGAMEMEDVCGNGGQVVFTEEAWRQAYRDMEQMFPHRNVMGWFLCGEQDRPLSPLNFWQQHGEYFPEKHQLMYLNCGLDGEEALYMASQESFYKLRGYYIYYERNQMMQDYMVSRKEAHRVESGARDAVIQDFRKRLEDRQTEARRRHSLVGTLGTACAALTVLVMAGGVVMFNNYQKMKAMESVIASVVPEGTSTGWSNLLTLGKDDDGYEVDIEELPGEVYPTRAEIVIETEAGSGAAGAQEVWQAGQAQGAAGQVQGGVGMSQDTGNMASGSSGAAGAAASAGTETQEAEPVQVPADAVVHVVQQGETLYGICMQRYQSLSPMEEICRWNGLEDENRLSIGQELYVPPAE